jgi:Flp pilus assembly protein TadD
MRIAPAGTADEAGLAALERQLTERPDSADLQFRRACALEDLGRPERAAAAYAALLEREPQHLGARTNLGLMLHDRGDLRGARSLLAQAVASAPLAPIAHVNLAATLLALGDAPNALQHYGHALALDPAFFAAHHGIALVYEALGDAPNAARHFERAFAGGAAWTLPFTGAGTPLRVLLFVSGRGGDLIAHPFLDPRFVETTLLVPEGVRDGATLPPHDVVFNGIGDADRCGPALARAGALLADAPTRAINPPDRVARTGRAMLPERIGALDGVVVPRIERFARAALGVAALASAGWSYPLLVRVPGYQAGRYLAFVGEPAALANALATLPGDELYAIAFADTRDADGMYRKYRVLVVGGRVLPVHLAVSREWMVHYFSAQTAEHDAYRAEERRFLADPRGTLGDAVVDRLAAIGAALGLDYGGIDFGLDRAGRIVVFEANATMAVFPPEPGERSAYRRPAYDAVVGAVRALLAARAAERRGALAAAQRSPST